MILVQKFPRAWDKITCVNFLQRRIILNSIAYYELDSPQITDREYDELSKQLVELQSEIDVNETQYGYCMYDFDGSTGFHLYDRLSESDKEYLIGIAHVGIRELGKLDEKPKKKKRKGGLF